MLTYWLISYVRLLKSPAFYYVSADYREDDPSLIQKRLWWCHRCSCTMIHVNNTQSGHQTNFITSHFQRFSPELHTRRLYSAVKGVVSILSP
jgi:hypothetical protein